MITQYNATLHLDSNYQLLSEDVIDQLHERFARYSAATMAGLHDETVVVITVRATSLARAARKVATLVADLPGLVRIQLETSADYDRAAMSLPPLVSTAEAAKRLGVTRQAILARVNSGTLPATRVGMSFGIPLGALRP